MPRISAERRAARRQEILEAARRCFARNGLHATTTDDICREAGVSAGAVYTYFDSKGAIIEAFVKTQCEALMAQFGRVAMEGGAVAQSLPALAREWGSSPRSTDDIRASVHLFAEGARDPDVAALLREADREPRRALASLIHAGQRTGEINPQVDPDAVARIVVAIAQGLLIQLAWEDFDLGQVVIAAAAVLGNRLFTTDSRGPSGGCE